MNTFRVLQFNMQFGQGWDPAAPDDAPVAIDASIAEIRRHDADVILLQEVERALPGGAQQEPPPNYRRLQQALAGYHGWFAYPRADPRELPFGIGLALFSRAPLHDLQRIDIASPAVEFEFQGRRTTPTDRLLIGARTTLLGREVQLFNTHLLAFFMLGTTSTAHPWQRRMIADLLATAGDRPTLLAGDFNVSRHEALVAQFAAAGFATVQEAEVTWRRRPYVLDHIFHNAPLRPVRHSVVPTLASDHHALVADFEFA